MNLLEKITDAKNDENTRGETSRRLRYTLGSWAETSFGNIEIKGLEYLKEIPKDKKVVIATSHISDLDVLTAAYKLGKYFDLVVTDQSVHHKFFEEAPTNIGIRMAGKKNFLPLDYVKRDGKKEPRFNPENFVPMKEALENGKAIIMAAHGPTKSGLEIEGSGVGAVYLAQLSDSIILPVAVNIKTDRPLGMAGKEWETLTTKPDTDVIIGSPLELDKIEDVDFIKEAIDKRKSGEKLSKDEIEKFSSVVAQLRSQSIEVLKAIAQMLPESKRGPYKEGLKNN